MGRKLRHEAFMGNQNLETEKPRRAYWAWALVVAGGLERLVGWGGSIDFVLARWDEPAWVGNLMTAILDYASVLGLLALVGGFYAIIRNERKRSDTLYGTFKDQLENAPDFAAQFQHALSEGGVVLDGRVFDPPPEEKSLIYVGVSAVSVVHMTEENRVELCIIAFNGYDCRVKIKQPRNHVMMIYKTSPSESATEKLSTPVLLTDRGPVVAEPRSEFMMVLHQYLTQTQIASINTALDIGNVTFDLMALEVDVESDDDKLAIFRIPFNRSPNVARANNGDFKHNYTVSMRTGLAMSG